MVGVITVHGAVNVKAFLATLPEQMAESAFKELMQQAVLMRDLAKIYVRVDTGSLRDSIRLERSGRGRRAVAVRAGGYVVNPDTGRLVDYAVYVERKYPFMRPAYEEIAANLVSLIERKVVEDVSQ